MPPTMQRTIALVIASVAISLAMTALATILVRFGPDIRARIREAREAEVPT